MNKFVYPVCIEKEPGKSGYRLIRIPDIDGYTEGTDLANCLDMAYDYIGNYLVGTEEPIQPNTKNIEPKEDEISTLVAVDKDLFELTLDTNLVKKTLNIPSYLNELGKKANVNFSQTLTDALKIKLGV